MKKAILVPLSLALAVSVSAQVDTTSQKNLDEVVVTGQYKPQSVKNSVYQVRVITAQQIRKQAPSKLQDVLNNQLNIRFSQDLATGGSNLSMLGLSGQNVKVLIDGVPMIGRQGTSNEININQIEVNSIERIEIIEGPMSVVYGADALAGVINIITKKPRNESFSINARVHEETVGKEYGWDQGIHNQYLGGTYNYKNWYVSGGVGRNLFQGWKDTAIGRELTWHKKDQIVANGTVGYRSGKLNVYYRIDGLDEIITNPANPVSASQPAVDQDYMTNRIMQQVQGTYLFSSKLSANALASYTHFTRQVYSTLYYANGDVRVATAPGLHSLATFNGFAFRGSAVYKPSSIVSFQPGVDINLETGEGERMKTGNQRINDYAFFLTSEITPTPRINIRPGLRFINNSVYDAPPVIPSVNTKFTLTKKIDLRLAYARGFRSPSLRELYYDFFDASHSITGNPDLEAEHSNSFTGSLDWTGSLTRDWKLKVILSAFYNDVKNMIDFATDAANPTVTTYMNITNYKTRGATISGQLSHGNLEATAGFGYTGRYNSYVEDDKSLPDFQWSPEVNTLVNYTFPKLGLGINLYYKYTGQLPRYSYVTTNGVEALTLVKTEGYHWADLTVNKTLVKVLTLNAGIRNLFDVTSVGSSAITGNTAHATSGIQPIGSGRSYFVGLAFSFTGNK
ncbi:MAG: TonB-dependent receptor [Chitinophagaceae bacterium]|nr:MAG: TonB-dependent receptor [Chitinophagaceae bacterium]